MRLPWSTSLVIGLAAVGCSPTFLIGSWTGAGVTTAAATPTPDPGAKTARHAMLERAALARAAERLQCPATEVTLAHELGAVRARGCGRETAMFWILTESNAATRVPGHADETVELALVVWLPLDLSVDQALGELRERMAAAGLDPAAIREPRATIRQQIALGVQAAHDLDCPRTRIASMAADRRPSIAEGCGRRASYSGGSWTDPDPKFTLIALVPLDPTTGS